LLSTLTLYADAIQTLSEGKGNLDPSAKEKALGPEQPDVGLSLCNIAVYLDELGQLSEAVEQGGVELPLDAAAYDKFLQGKIETSRFKRGAKRVPGVITDDLAASYKR